MGHGARNAIVAVASVASATLATAAIWAALALRFHAKRRPVTQMSPIRRLQSMVSRKPASWYESIPAFTLKNRTVRAGVYTGMLVSYPDILLGCRGCGSVLESLSVVHYLQSLGAMHPRPLREVHEPACLCMAAGHGGGHQRHGGIHREAHRARRQGAQGRRGAGIRRGRAVRGG